IEQFRNVHKLGLNELEDFNMGSSNASGIYKWLLLPSYVNYPIALAVG
nr:hypothetical protein [Helicobacter pylori]